MIRLGDHLCFVEDPLRTTTSYAYCVGGDQVTMLDKNKKVDRAAQNRNRQLKDVLHSLGPRLPPQRRDLSKPEQIDQEDDQEDRCDGIVPLFVGYQTVEGLIDPRLQHHNISDA
jgi:hypothetical protein